MQLFYEVMVCYDIEDNKLRKKIGELLKDIGLERIQYSVFWGFLNTAEESNIKRKLDDMLKANSTDRCIILRSNLSDNGENTAIGYNNNYFTKRNNYELF